MIDNDSLITTDASDDTSLRPTKIVQSVPEEGKPVTITHDNVTWNAKQLSPVVAITRCRSCHSGDLRPVLNLGDMVVSDFLTEGKAELVAPLELIVCGDCGLVQLAHTVSRDLLYCGKYWYRSGVNESMRTSLQDVVNDALRHKELTIGDRVLDIGCNDGTMLEMFPGYVHHHGYEPSSLARLARKDFAIIWQDYFPPAQEQERTTKPKYQYDIITSIACFYSIADPVAFVHAIKAYLYSDGIWICQMQDLDGMLASNGLDNICHEHLAYWSTYSFTRLLDRYGLEIVDLSRNATNGGSVRYTIKHVGSHERIPDTGQLSLRNIFLSLTKFGRDVTNERDKAMRLMDRLKKKGARIYGMGASTKFTTLAQFYGLTSDYITAIGERSPEKIGLKTAGTHIPIISEEEVLAQKPDYIWCGPWHFITAFQERYAATYRGKWIVPLPRLKVV